MDKSLANETLANVADTVIEKDYRFEIIIVPQNKVHEWLQKRGLMPKKKAFSIRPIVAGNLYRISKLLLSINYDALQTPGTKRFIDLFHRMVVDHSETLWTICAIAMQNNRQEPSPKLIKLIRDNLSSQEMFQLLAYVLDKMDSQNFISSIILIRGLNVQESAEKKIDLNEVSPSNQGS